VSKPPVKTSSITPEQFEMKLEELKLCYDRMNRVSDQTIKQTTLFYAISSALLTAIAALVVGETPVELLVAMAFIGYVSSVANLLVDGKYILFAWGVFAKRAQELEEEIDFKVSRVYNDVLKESKWRFASVGWLTFIFKSFIVVLWCLVIGYFIQAFSDWPYILAFLLLSPLVVVAVTGFWYSKTRSK
jgi:hypothetical protein